MVVLVLDYYSTTIGVEIVAEVIGAIIAAVSNTDILCIICVILQYPSHRNSDSSLEFIVVVAPIVIVRVVTVVVIVA